MLDRKKLSHAPLLTAMALAAALVSATSPNIAHGQTSGGTQGSQPSADSVRALVMNNWNDFLAIHYARQLYKKDSHQFGPYLVALHSAADWTVNQIDGATAFFHADLLDQNGNPAGQGQPTGPERPQSLCEASGEAQGDDAPADNGVRQSYPSVMCFDDSGR